MDLTVYFRRRISDDTGHPPCRVEREVIFDPENQSLSPAMPPAINPVNRGIEF